MINKLWTDVSLENYNNWYPLTGKIIETPQQYINTWPNVNDWFTTFAIRAQNDINAYLDFILSKFPFDSFKDELIKETLRDMVYVCVEHWVFNRTPIEFNVDATIQFNNGTSFSANSIPSINVWDLAPSRMKIWARLTELKQVFLNDSEDELDVDKIDLQAFYTKNQVDELIKEQKAFTLSKQMKLYDDLVDDNENEIYRGAVSKFINKSYVATEYDKETETMILDWPDEIGTLPPEALQNNPQIGDFTHAATADFSAKQQKRITTNENEITKLNSELIKTNENINDIKNNWFNIATSPLWKKMSSFIPSNEFGKIYLAIWGYSYQSTTNPTDNYIYSNKKTIFNLGGEIQRTTQKSIKLDELIVNDNVKIQLLFTKEWNDITVVSNDDNYKSISVVLYQYIGKGTPTEFIAEPNKDNDYYTKQETNELLDKKQNIDDNNLQTTVKQIVPAINENKSNIDKKQDKLTLIKEDITYKVLQYKELGTGLFTGDLDMPPTIFIKKWINESISLDNYYTKPEVDEKLKNKVDSSQFKFAFMTNVLGTNNPDLLTTDKTLVGAINELKEKIKDKKFANEYFKCNTETNEISLHDEENSLLCKDLLENNEYKLLKTQNKKLLYAINEILEKQPQPTPSPCPCPKWKDVAVSNDRINIQYKLKSNTFYRIFYDWEAPHSINMIGKYPTLIKEFFWTNSVDNWEIYVAQNLARNTSIMVIQNTVTNKITLRYASDYYGNLWKLQELQE